MNTTTHTPDAPRVRFERRPERRPELVATVPAQPLTAEPEPAAQPQRKGVERRRQRRFKVAGAGVGVNAEGFAVPGAFAQVRERGLWARLRARREVMELRDLSCGGLSFDSDRPYSVGQQVTVQLHVPDWCEPMRLAAQVRWVKPLYEGMLYAVGVEFGSFDDRQNLSEALAALKQLETKHA